MNYNHIDNIKLSRDDYFQLFKWKDNNRSSVRNFNPVLEEGVIIIEKNITQYFKQEGINIYFEVYFGNLFFFSIIIQRLEDGKSLLKEQTFNEKVVSELDYPEEKAIEDAITLHASLMAYMEYFMENKMYVKKEAVQKSLGNKKKRKDKRRVQVVKIQQRVYTIKLGENTQVVQTKREIVRQADKWTVRGHWRNLKNGRKVWVKPYTKGNGDKVTPKTYVL